MNIYIKILIFSLIIVLKSSKSYAYIDPGTGSIILQAILAAIAGAIGYLTFFWQKTKAFFKKIFKTNKKIK
jgi:hypothetical protein